MKPKDIMSDINTHEFTLECLDELYSNDQVLMKKLRKVKFKGAVRFIAVLGVVYYGYKKIDERIKKLEKENTKE